MKKLAMVLMAAAMSFSLTACIDDDAGGSCGSYGSCSSSSFGTGYYCSGGSEDGFCYSTLSYCISDCE